MSLFSSIKEKGIHRIQFFLFLIVWFIVGAFIRALMNAATMSSDGMASIIVLVLIFAHFAVLASAVYLRMKNANVNYTLAVICCFIPFLQLAPIIAGLWYKPENSIGNMAYLKEKYHTIKDSGTMAFLSIVLPLFLVGVGYIYNIVWIVDHWHRLEIFGKMIHIASILIPPMGGILGIFHIF